MGAPASSGTAKNPVVAWLSLGFGYGADLMYFEQLFTGLKARFPKAILPIMSSFPAEKHPNLPLLPILRFIDIPQPRRQAGASSYATIIRLVTPASVIRLARRRPSVIIITEFSMVSLAGWTFAKTKRLPMVLLVESDPSYRGAPSSSLVVAVKSFVARHCDSILVCNQSGADYLTNTLKVPADRVMIGPYLTSNPAGPDLVDPTDRTGPVHLLFLNSVSLRKGVAELINALARTPKELRESWLLDVVGDGDQEDALRTLISKHGLEDNVVWHGRVPYAETGKYYRDADVVISSTLADYRSLSGFEAINAGRPLITSVWDGASEELAQLAPVVEVVDPLDEAAFAEVLTPYLSRTDWQRAQAAKAMQVPERFSVDAACDNLAGAIYRALERRPSKH